MQNVSEISSRGILIQKLSLSTTSTGIELSPESTKTYFRASWPVCASFVISRMRVAMESVKKKTKAMLPMEREFQPCYHFHFSHLLTVPLIFFPIFLPAAILCCCV